MTWWNRKRPEPEVTTVFPDPPEGCRWNVRESPTTGDVWVDLKTQDDHLVNSNIVRIGGGERATLTTLTSEAIVKTMRSMLKVEANRARGESLLGYYPREGNEFDG